MSLAATGGVRGEEETMYEGTDEDREERAGDVTGEDTGGSEGPAEGTQKIGDEGQKKEQTGHQAPDEDVGVTHEPDDD